MPTEMLVNTVLCSELFALKLVVELQSVNASIVMTTPTSTDVQLVIYEPAAWRAQKHTSRTQAAQASAAAQRW